MAEVILPRVPTGKDMEQKVQNLTDYTYKLRKELEFILQNLDNLNIDEAYIKKLTADSIKANVIESGTVITQSLYASMANIAELTVDRLETSTKVQNYLASDTSDVNYIKIYDQHFRLITAKTDGLTTEQLKDRSLNPIFWVDITHGGTTLIANSFPVVIYKYTEYDKMDISFEAAGTDDIAQITMGTGNGVGDEQKAFIYKDATGITIKYVQDGGDVLSLKLGEDGVTINESPYHKITVGTADPTGGVDGDIYFKAVS